MTPGVLPQFLQGIKQVLTSIVVSFNLDDIYCADISYLLLCFAQRARKRATDSEARETTTWKASENHGENLILDENASL